MSTAKVWEDGYRQAIEDVESGTTPVKLPAPAQNERRFQAAVAAMQGLLAKGDTVAPDYRTLIHSITAASVDLADALLQALAEGEKP